MALAVLMLLLGANKQLDLQTALTSIGRSLADRQGLLYRRRQIQALFVAAFVAGIAVAMTIAAHARPPGRWYAMCLGGIVSLGVFVVMRAASFHHIAGHAIDALDRYGLHNILEAAGIVAITASALSRDPQADTCST